jgi:LysR family glycine cleavage system transcriptional activator
MQPSDLREQVLLHYDNGEEWSRWLRAASVEGIDTTVGPRFNDCNLLLQAAAEGQGVAMTFTALAARELLAGQLVKPFELQLLPEAWYYVVSPEVSAGRPKTAAFREWVLEQAKASTQEAIAA